MRHNFVEIIFEFFNQTKDRNIVVNEEMNSKSPNRFIISVSFKNIARRYVQQLMQIRLPMYGPLKCIVLCNVAVAKGIDVNFSSRPEFGSSKYYSSSPDSQGLVWLLLASHQRVHRCVKQIKVS